MLEEQLEPHIEQDEVAGQPGRSVGANITKLLSSRLAAQGILLAAAPVMSRLFPPGSFGVFEIFISVASVLMVVACFRYELSIPLGRSRSEASASFALSLAFAFFSTLIVLALIPVFGERMARWFETPRLRTLLWLMPIAVFLAGFRSSLRYMAARDGRFGLIAWSGLGSALGGISVPVLWGVVIGASATGLLAGYLTGIMSGILLLFVFLCRNLMIDVKRTDFSFWMLWTVAKRHKKFPIFSTWSILLNTVSVRSPGFILGLFFSTTVAGYYSLGQRIVGLPVSLIGVSIAQVFLPAGAREYNETGTLSGLVRDMFGRLVQIGVFPAVVLIFLGPALFEFVFGHEWIEAGTYAQILACWSLFAFIYSPLSTVFAILNRQGLELLLNVLIVLGRVFGLLIGVTLWSPRGTLGIFVAFSVLATTGLLICILVLSRVSVLWASKKTLKYIIFSCVLILPIRLASWIIGTLGVTLAAVLATVIYITVLFRSEPMLKEFVRKSLGRLGQGRSYSRQLIL